MADALITINQTLDGDYIANVLGFSNVTETATELQEIADDIRLAWANGIASDLSALWSLDSVTFAFIAGGAITYSVDYSFTLGALTGNNNTDMLPAQNCLLVSTGYIGAKPNRGRIYLGGLCEDATSNGVWTAAIIGRANVLVTNLADGIGPVGNTVFLRIVGRPAANGGLYVSAPVQTINVRGRVAIQRGRRRGE